MNPSKDRAFVPVPDPRFDYLEGGQVGEEPTVRGRLEECLGRIDAYEDKVGAWAYLDRERAYDEALKMDAMTRDLDLPLRGVIVGVKDIIDVGGMPTRCGMEAWSEGGRRVPEGPASQDSESPVVRRLREAGALVLGKTVTTAHAYLDPARTRNPHDYSRSPGGSSSGSAAAVSAGMCDLALGTQTGGSLLRPASYCGVYVIKPGFGVLETQGIRELARSLDHPGMMARSLPLLKHAFHVVANAAERRARWEGPLRVGVFESGLLQHVELGMFRRFGWAVETLEAELGRDSMARVREPEGFAEIPEYFQTILSVEAAQVHDVGGAEGQGDLPPRIRELCERGRQTSEASYVRAIERQKSLQAGARALFEECDVLLFPSATGVAPDPSTTGNPILNSIWSFLGLPVIGLPLPVSSSELPLGLQIIGKPGSDLDGSLFDTAQQIDVLLRKRANT